MAQEGRPSNPALLAFMRENFLPRTEPQLYAAINEANRQMRRFRSMRLAPLAQEREKFLDELWEELRLLRAGQTFGQEETRHPTWTKYGL